jgi:hypothetical protein
MLFADAVARIDRALRNIDHRVARADAGNPDHSNRLAGGNAGRQRRPDSAWGKLRNARWHFRRQTLIRVLGIDREDRELTRLAAALDAVARIDRATAPAAAGKPLVRMAREPAPRARRPVADVRRATAARNAVSWVNAFIDAVIGIDGASCMIKMNGGNPD